MPPRQRQHMSTGMDKMSGDRRGESMALRTTLAVAIASLMLVGGCTKESPEALIRSAQGQMTQGNFRAAVIEAKNAVESAPKSGTAYRLLGSALLGSGDPSAAEAPLRKALSLSEAPDDVLPDLAESLIRQGRADRLIDEFGTRRLQTPVADAAFQTSLGRAWTQRGDMGRAGEAFAAALAAVPGYAPARLGQARLTAHDGRLAEASTVVDEVIAAAPRLAEAYAFKAQLLLAQDQPKEASEALERALAIEPADLPVRLALASQRIDQQAYDAAQTLLDAKAAYATRDLRATYLRSLLALRRGELQKARDDISVVLNAAPDNVAALILAADIELRSENSSLAQARLEKALSLEPSSSPARELLAVTLLRQGRPAKAIDLLTPLLARARPADARLFMLAGEAYLAEGDPERAAAFFERSASNPGSGSAARVKLGQIALTRGDFERGAAELQAASAMDAQPGQADLLLFALHLRRHETDQALAAAELFTKKQAGNPLGHVLMGTAHLSARDLKSARQDFDAASRMQADYLPALRGLADLDLAEGRPDDALRRYQPLLAKTPGDERLLVVFAELQERAGKTAEADATLRRAIAASPRTAEPYIALARLHLHRHEPQAAIAAASQGVAANPTEPRLRELLGDVQEAAGANGEAIKAFEEMAWLQPEATAPLLKLAASQTRIRDFNSAARTLRLAQRSAPDNDEIAQRLVAAYLSAARFDDALEVATAWKARRPESVLGPMLEGDVSAAQRKWPQAVRAYQAALVIKPRSEAAGVKLARSLSGAGHADEGEKFAAEWLARNPDDMTMRLYVADVNLKAKRYPAAVGQYEAVLRRDPDSVPALNNLAWALGELKDPRALGFAERAAALASDNPVVLDTLGMLQLERGDIEQAFGSLTRVRQLAPDRKDLRLHYAIGLLRAGRAEEGKAELRELLASRDDFPGKATIATLLGKS